MVRKVLLVCGILSSLLYLAMNILGATRYEGYSSAQRHLKHEEFRNVVRREQANQPAGFRYRDRILLRFGDSREHAFERIRCVASAIIPPHYIGHV